MLVEQQVPRLEYSFDVALGDEEQDSEEAEVRMITLSDHPIPQITTNERDGPASLSLYPEALSSKPAAVESEFETWTNIEIQQNSSNFPQGAHFDRSGTFPHPQGTNGEKNEFF